MYKWVNLGHQDHSFQSHHSCVVWSIEKESKNRSRAPDSFEVMLNKVISLPASAPDKREPRSQLIETTNNKDQKIPIRIRTNGECAMFVLCVPCGLLDKNEKPSINIRSVVLSEDRETSVTRSRRPVSGPLA